MLFTIECERSFLIRDDLAGLFVSWLSVFFHNVIFKGDIWNQQRFIVILFFFIGIGVYDC